jgi:hypothetical protein
MCTVSWLHDDNGYLLFCNRDEKRSRAKALGPQVNSREGVRFIAPTDSAAGGTWIGVNEFGISLCLLNGAHVGAVASKSRGLLIPDLLSAVSVQQVIERVTLLDLSPFSPFTLAILAAGRRAVLIAWNCATKSITATAEAHMPLVSSAFDADGVRSRRHKEFRRITGGAGRLNAAALLDFHRSHGTAPDAYSVCMHRPDAETVSFSSIRVTRSEVEFYYAPEAPCRSLPGQVLRADAR